MKNINGVWVAEEQDAWELERTLRPIIGAGIRKFIEEGIDSCPNVLVDGSYCTDWDEEDEEKLDKSVKVWKDILNKIDFAFNAPEPDTEAYDFSLKMVKLKEEPDGLLRTYIKINNEEEYERYNTDMAEYEAKKQEGYELFGKYLVNLWS